MDGEETPLRFLLSLFFYFSLISLYAEERIKKVREEDGGGPKDLLLFLAHLRRGRGSNGTRLLNKK